MKKLKWFSLVFLLLVLFTINFSCTTEESDDDKEKSANNCNDFCQVLSDCDLLEELEIDSGDACQSYCAEVGTEAVNCVLEANPDCTAVEECLDIMPDALTLELPSGVVVTIELDEYNLAVLPVSYKEVTLELAKEGAAPIPSMDPFKELGGSLFEILPDVDFENTLIMQLEIPASLIPEGQVPSLAFYNEERERWTPVTVLNKSEEGSETVVLEARISHFSKWMTYSLTTPVHNVEVTVPPNGGYKVDVAVELDTVYYFTNFDAILTCGNHEEDDDDFFGSCDPTWESKVTFDGNDSFSFTVAKPGKYHLKIENSLINLDIWDQDIVVGDALDPTNYTNLAAAYAPIFSFAEGEEYAPVPMGYSYFEDRFVTINVPHTKSQSWYPYFSDPSAIMDYLGSHGHNNGIIEGNLAFKWNSPKNPPEDNDFPMYFVVQEKNAYLFITYWLFYSYDAKELGDGVPNWIKEKLGSHDRDRESVTVVLRKANDTSAYSPVALFYFGHLETNQMRMISGMDGNLDEPTIPEWTQGKLVLDWQDVDRDKTGAHPVVYVAHGSHAMYPRYGTYEVDGTVGSFPYTVPEIAGGDVVICSEETDIEGMECEAGVHSYLEPLGVNDDLSFDEDWRLLAFSGWWIDETGFSNAKFPPFVNRYYEFEEWDSQSFENSGYFPESLGGDEEEESVTETSISGAIPGVFSTEGGEFEVHVSPLDENGNLIYEDVTVDNFEFTTIYVHDLYGGYVTSGEATVVSIEAIPPSDPTHGVTVALDLDSSGSMSSNDPDELRKGAAKDFIDILNGTDEAAIMDFGAGYTSPFSNTRLLQDFTTDKTLLKDAVDSVTASSQTPMYESLYEILDYLNGYTTINTALMVMTDGIANSDSLFDEVVARAIGYQIPIYAISLGTNIDFTLLQELAAQTNGGFASALDPMDLADLFVAIGVAVQEGRIIVHGEGIFDPEIPSAGTYVVSGSLVTHIGAGFTETPFDFTVEIDESGKRKVISF